MPIDIIAAKLSNIDEMSLLDAEVSGQPRSTEWYRTHVEREQCVIALLDGKFAGLAVWNETFFQRPFMWLIVVQPSLRRRGVASALLLHLEDRFRSMGLFTSTNRSNTVMQRLLELRGYVRSGYIENLDENDPEIIYYKKS